MDRRNPKFLLVTSHFPLGRTYGSQLRVLNLCRLLKRIGSVSLVIASSEKDEEGQYKATANEFEVKHLAMVRPKRIQNIGERMRFELDASFMNTHYETASDADRDIVKRLVDEHDSVWVHTIRVANIFRIYRWPHTILDIDDIPSRLYWSKTKVEPRIIKRIIDCRMALIWRRRERDFRNRFEVMSVCSENDKRYMGNGSNIQVIPNGFDLPKTPPEYAPVKPARIGFIGLLDYLPNKSGIEWFIREVWPLIKRNSPETRLRLVGRGSDKGFPMMGKDIDGLGYVEDPKEEIATWAAMIVPVRYGGGTRVKIAEAFSRKCPVVSTPLGAFGYELDHGKELLLARKAEDFAEACIRLIKDKELAARITENAWKEFLRGWTWESIGQAVENAVQTCRELSGRELGDAEFAGNRL